MSASHMIDSVKYNLGQLKDRREVFDTSKFQKKSTVLLRIRFA